MIETILIAVLAMAAGLLVGWLLSSRHAGALANKLAVAQSRAAEADIARKAHDEVERERNDAHREVSELRARGEMRDAAARDLTLELHTVRDRLATVEAERNSADQARAKLSAQVEDREVNQTNLAQDLAQVRVALAHEERTRGEALNQLAEYKARSEEREQAHRLIIQKLEEAGTGLSAQFGDTAAKLLAVAQDEFLKRADARFQEAGKTADQKIASLLQPVETTLKRYEESLGRIEKEREGSYRELAQAVSQLSLGNASVIKETQRLTNVMRSSPKARGRWGEEQLRNILESAGLAANIDFTLQTTVADGDRQLRPDCVVNLPGNRCIVIDVKCPLVAFEQAYDEEDDTRRSDLLLQHANALKSYANDLGRKSYWRQFERSPDFVIMFIPGEHFLSAAAERAPDMIESAYQNGVVIASTINMLALAKFMSGMWRQEILAEQAKEIADVGKELFSRLSILSDHVSDVGRNLGLASKAYNSMVSSLERNVYTQAQRLERLGIDKSGKSIKIAPLVEEGMKSLTKLIAATDADKSASDLII